MDFQASTSNIQPMPFSHTQSALICLQKCLECSKCCQMFTELYTLGQCEHRFCWSCAQDRQGTTCPVCNMPSYATLAHKDKQLSSIATLCLQMSDLLNGKQALVVAEKGNDDQVTEKQNVAVTKLKRNRISKSEMSSPEVQRCSTSEKQCSKNNLVTPKTRKHNATYSTSSDMNRKSKRNGAANVKEKTAKLETRNPSELKENRLVTSYLSDLKSNASPGHGRKRKKSEHQDLQAKESSSSENHEKFSTPKTSYVRDNGSGRKSERSAAKGGTSKTYLTKRNAKGETLLQVATIKADVDTVKNLLDEGANPNVRDNAGWTPLHEAVNHGNATIAELLINYGASINAPGLDNDTPLHDAVINYHLDCVRLLVSKGANTMSRNINGHTPLDKAQTDEMREILLTAGGVAPASADINTSMNQMKDFCDKPLCFLGTALSKDEQAMLLKCAKMLNAKMVDSSSEVTHLITGVNAEGMCPRTLKYLNVLLAGKWVVNTKWLHACLECGSSVPEEEFEIAGCTNNPNTMAPAKSRQNALDQLPGLFAGCQFYFQGKFRYPTPSREELAGLVKLGGGVILTREPRLHNLDDYPCTVPFHANPSSGLADCAIFVIFDDTCPNPPYVEAHRMAYLPVSWLMDSIASFALLDKTVYLKY